MCGENSVSAILGAECRCRVQVQVQVQVEVQVVISMTREADEEGRNCGLLQITMC
jgi:hypothetical protein